MPESESMPSTLPKNYKPGKPKLVAQVRRETERNIKSTNLAASHSAPKAQPHASQTAD